MRRRRGLQAQERTRRYLTSVIEADARARRPRCGCPKDEPEADPKRWPCPCGAHCEECPR